MRKLTLFILVIFAVSLLAVGCGGAKDNAPQAKKPVVKVGATAVPHAEILNVVKPLLDKEGVDLQIIEFTDYVRPNIAVAEKEIDANYFQHIPYLNQFIADRNLQLTYVAAVHIEPMGIYSKKVKNLNELAKGAQVAIPNDPTNGGRALSLLAKAGLIKLKDGVGVKGTVKDIVDNPKGLAIKELEAPLLPRSLDDVAIAVINTNYALEAKLVPTKDALFLEPKDSPYANILTVRKGEENRPEIQKLAKVLTSPEVKKFIEDKYKGAVVPAF
ncbi:MAG: MetQ/NlpA family ABC transporter substrate-binding protein [Negativicutes bacterium]|nr:MetQ/NlpA family ABC transporter substrate-binding protein [Negativicutes bacterium]